VSWRGYIPAIVTPFTESGELDLRGLDRLLDWVAAEKMHGIIVAGTVGEWFSLEPADRKALLGAVSARLRGEVPLIAGCNAFSAAAVVANAQMAAEAGFDGIL